MHEERIQSTVTDKQDKYHYFLNLTQILWVYDAGLHWCLWVSTWVYVGVYMGLHRSMLVYAGLCRSLLVLGYHWLPLTTIDLAGDNREFEV